jgi:N-acetylglucosamine kinase-like BadF-type ATPase
LSYLCVDGGQTSTAVVLFDGEGGKLHAWTAGPITTASKPGAVENLRAVVRDVAGELRRRTREPPEVACFSLTGSLQGEDVIPGLIRAEMDDVMPGIGRIRTVPDYVGNWAAATGGKPGIVVISGGGAVAYGRNAAGEESRVGGWGHLLGDEGSGFWIGLEAVKAALKSRSGMIEKTALDEVVMEAFDAGNDGELLRKFYSGSVPDAEVAGLVPLVVERALDGDGASVKILDEAAGHLASMAHAALDALGDLPVSLSGGVFGAQTMRERFEAALAGSGAARVEAVRSDPLDGVFVIAREGL